MPRYSILDETNLPDRTLGYALDILLKRGLIVRMLDKKDARLRIYQIPSPIIIT
jgi:DNA-binding MarR family transcriptional regulator